MVHSVRFPKLLRRNYEEWAGDTIGSGGGLTRWQWLERIGRILSSRDLTDDNAQRVASIAADVPSSLRRSMCTHVLCSCEVSRSGRQTNLRGWS